MVDCFFQLAPFDATKKKKKKKTVVLQDPAEDTVDKLAEKTDALSGTLSCSQMAMLFTFSYMLPDCSL